MLKYEKYEVVKYGCNWAIRNSSTNEFLYRLKNTGEFGELKGIRNAIGENQKLRYDIALFGHYNKVDAENICEGINQNKIKLL